jgi:hypothetical protein
MIFWYRHQQRILRAVLYEAEEKVIISLKKLDKLGIEDAEERIQMRNKIKQWEEMEKQKAIQKALYHHLSRD